MRHYLKSVIISAFSVYIAYKLVPTINFGADPKNILFLIGGILVISVIISPIFALVLLPINHLTFGVLMLVLNIALIFGLLKFMPGFSISPYQFPGAEVGGVILPPLYFNKIAVIVLVSFIITFSYKALRIVFD